MTVDGVEMDVLINQKKQMNRAFDGDTVLIQLDPVKKWLRFSPAPEDTSKAESDTVEEEVEDDDSWESVDENDHKR